MLNLTNYHEHPADNRYMVYQFYQEDHAGYFQELLDNAGVPYERYEDREAERFRILFGVSKQYNRDTVKSNFLVHARYRSRFISNNALRWTVLLLVAIGLALAVAGVIHS
jgi:hypothetical protein